VSSDHDGIPGVISLDSCSKILTVGNHTAVHLLQLSLTTSSQTGLTGTQSPNVTALQSLTFITIYGYHDVIFIIIF